MELRAATLAILQLLVRLRDSLRYAAFAEGSFDTMRNETVRPSS